MTVEELNFVKKTEKTKNKNVLVGIRIDSHSREVLSWALVKVAEPGDSVIAVHVCRSSGNCFSFFSWTIYCFEFSGFVFLQ